MDNKIERTRPIENQDTQHYWQGLRDGKLLIQGCTDCGLRRHPPQPMCENCQSLEWTTIESAGQGTIYSYTVIHYPQIPPFEYPNAVVLVDLEEGVRLAAQLTGTDPEDIRIGQHVGARLIEVQEGLTLPVFEVLR